MLKTAITVFFLSLLFTEVGHAQTLTNGGPDTVQDDSIIKIAPSGLSGTEYWVGGRVSRVPFLEPELRTLLNEFPDSKALLASYDGKYVGAQILGWTGFAVAMTGVALGASQTSSSNPNTFLVGAGLGLAAIGLGSEIYGLTTLFGSYRDLSDSVNKYNSEALAAVKHD
jgi:hypothetical protein